MTAPSTPLLVPATLDKAIRSQLQTLNPGLVFVIPTDAGAAQAPEAGYHKDVVNLVCDIVDGVIQYGGPLAAIVAPGAAALPLILTIVKKGTEVVRNMVNGEPATEHWPLARLEAEPPAARPLP